MEEVVIPWEVFGVDALEEVPKKFQSEQSRLVFCGQHEMDGAEKIYDAGCVRHVSWAFFNSKKLGEGGVFHFTEVSCYEDDFHRTECLCVIVGTTGCIEAIEKHLPYKGECRNFQKD